MASPVSSSRVQSAIAKYGVFWQLWPQFDSTGGERRQVGFEVELIGFHTPDLNHVDPACPMCHHVRSVLLGVADLLLEKGVFSRDSLTYDIDSHSNSIRKRTPYTVLLSVHESVKWTLQQMWD
jgi:hypothetical protein